MATSIYMIPGKKWNEVGYADKYKARAAALTELNMLKEIGLEAMILELVEKYKYTGSIVQTVPTQPKAKRKAK